MPCLAIMNKEPEYRKARQNVTPYLKTAYNLLTVQTVKFWSLWMHTIKACMLHTHGHTHRCRHTPTHKYSINGCYM